MYHVGNVNVMCEADVMFRCNVQMYHVAHVSCRSCLMSLMLLMSHVAPWANRGERGRAWAAPPRLRGCGQSVAGSRPTTGDAAVEALAGLIAREGVAGVHDVLGD
jgi:hypothetical protein